MCIRDRSLDGGIWVNKKNLRMKSVGSEYLEQYNALLRYVFQVTDQELSSVGWQEKEIIRAKFPTMEKADVIGWFDGDTLVSQAAIYPMRVMIWGRAVSYTHLAGLCCRSRSCSCACARRARGCRSRCPEGCSCPQGRRSRRCSRWR